MFHLDNNSGVSAMPPVGTVQSSAPRWFTEGGGGTPASYPGADWYNIIQAELLNFLSAYGIAPDKADLSQLRKAIEAAIKDKATAKSPLLTAIAALVTSADKMPYFNGKDTVAMTALTAFAREVLAQTDAAGVLSKLHLEETVKLAANALSAKIVGEVMNNGTMASANKPGWWRIAVDDTDTVADFPVYPGGAKLYGYGLMFVEVIDGAWLQHYYSHHGQNAKRQDWATSTTANVLWVVDFNTSNPQRDIAGNAATATAATSAIKLKTPRTIAGVAFDGTANIDLGFLGYGQLLNDVTASRVKNVSYTNDTLKPVVVYVRFNNENNTTRKIYVNNYLLIEINQITGYDQPGACTFIVPAGGVYRVETTGTIVGWVEMK
ncbi:hypothetical protein [Citrobacter meridianamericanus]|uniref:hypothetical protein n=1 Tax=Citrobacter meridianamericanus TaxID=2894201 RepID=UPI0039BE1A16